VSFGELIWRGTWKNHFVVEGSEENRTKENFEALTAEVEERTSQKLRGGWTDRTTSEWRKKNKNIVDERKAAFRKNFDFETI
jgi:hypothetical protein